MVQSSEGRANDVIHGIDADQRFPCRDVLGVGSGAMRNEGGYMPLFITQGRFTQDALAGMLANPEDRAEAVGQLFAKSGGKLHAYYFTFGKHDFLIVSEGSTEAATTTAIIAAASGRVTDLQTNLAMTSAEMKEAFAKAGPLAADFRPAGR
jgi:uncharacterized protein with GYD domain